MSPALLNKYLQAAREVADHVVLTPDGFDFAPYPMLVETDRDRYAIQRIVGFYRRAAHRLRRLLPGRLALQVSRALKKPHATLATIAAESKLSPKYLPLVWQILHDQDAVGPVAQAAENVAGPAPSGGGSARRPPRQMR